MGFIPLSGIWEKCYYTAIQPMTNQGNRRELQKLWWAQTGMLISLISTLAQIYNSCFAIINSIFATSVMYKTGMGAFKKNSHQPRIEIIMKIEYIWHESTNRNLRENADWTVHFLIHQRTHDMWMWHINRNVNHSFMPPYSIPSIQVSPIDYALIICHFIWEGWKLSYNLSQWSDMRASGVQLDSHLTNT